MSICKTCSRPLSEKPEPIARSVSQQARRIDVHPATMYEAIRLGEIEVVRIGKRCLVTDAAVAAYLASKAMAVSPRKFPGRWGAVAGPESHAAPKRKAATPQERHVTAKCRARA